MTDQRPTPISSAGGMSAPDFIYGAEEIARFLGISVRKVYYLTEKRNRGKGRIPINNLPSIGLCANRKALVDYLNGQRQV
jgi:hypothetical protein